MHSVKVKQLLPTESVEITKKNYIFHCLLMRNLINFFEYAKKNTEIPN